MAGQPLTSATIRPVKSGVGYVKNDTVGPAELAQVDKLLSTCGLDTVAADTISGPISVAQDPNNPSDQPLITAPNPVGVSGAGATFGTSPGGGTLILSNTPVYSAPRSRTVRHSTLELCRQATLVSANLLYNGPVFPVPTGTNAPVVYGGGIGVQCATGGGVAQLLQFGLPKPHDGATINEVKVWFFVPMQPTTLPIAMPGVAVVRIPYSGTPGTAGFQTLKVQAFPTPSNVAAWYAGGQPQAVVLTGLSNNVVDISNYSYVVQIQDAAISRSGQLPFPVWTAVEIQYTAIGDERYSQ